MKQHFNLLKISFILLFLPSFINAQVTSWQWAKTTGGSSNQFIKLTTTDNNGNFYTFGSFSSTEIIFDDIILTTTYPTSLFITKYNSNGDVLWAKKIESNSAASLDENSISIDKDNNLILGGTATFVNNLYGDISFNSGNLILNFNNISPQDMRYFIAKFDTNGNILWAKNNQGYSESISIETDDENNIYSIGSFKSSVVTFDTFSINNKGQNDLFITKYDKNGNVIWVKSYGGSTDDLPKQIIRTNDGNFTIIGYFGSPTITSQNTTLTNNGEGWNLFILKIDSEGNIISAVNAGTAENNYNNFLKIYRNDNFYLFGYFETPTITIGNTKLTKIGNADMYIAKYNTNGILSWAKNFGNIESTSVINDITADSNGNIYLASDFSSPTITFGSSTFTNNGIYTTLVLKLNNNGDFIWGKSTLGNIENKGNFPSSIILNYNNDLYLTGVYNSQKVSFDNNIISNTDTRAKIYIASLLQTSLSNQEFYTKNVKLYPNPVNSFLNLKNDQTFIGNNYSIIDVTGRIITKGIINNEIDRIDVDNLKNGLYFFNTSNGSSIKFIKNSSTK
jgi:hypothetical protein